MTSPVAVITRICEGSYWLMSGLPSPKMLARVSAGGVGVGVGVGVAFGVAAASAATGEPPVGPPDGCEQAATSGRISSGSKLERFKRR